MATKVKREAELRRRRRLHVKRKTHRDASKLVLVVTRSARHITGQVVDLSIGRTLVSASSVERVLKEQVKIAGAKLAVARQIGLILGQRAVEKSISEVVFDRNGNLYHGRVKALADGARESGLKF